MRTVNPPPGNDPILGGDLNDLLKNVDAALTATRERVKEGIRQVDDDHAAAATLLKSASAKRMIESDPLLKQQLQSVDNQFKADQKRAADAQSQLADAQKLAMNEFARLRKMISP